MAPPSCATSPSSSRCCLVRAGLPPCALCMLGWVCVCGATFPSSSCCCSVHAGRGGGLTGGGGMCVGWAGVWRAAAAQWRRQQTQQQLWRAPQQAPVLTPRPPACAAVYRLHDCWRDHLQRQVLRDLHAGGCTLPLIKSINKSRQMPTTMSYEAASTAAEPQPSCPGQSRCWPPCLPAAGGCARPPTAPSSPPVPPPPHAPHPDPHPTPVQIDAAPAITFLWTTSIKFGLYVPAILPL